MPPRVAVIAGPNGSGKSTFYERKLSRQFPVFVNADRIGLTLSQLPGEARNLEAAKQAETTRKVLIERRETFCFETVFSRTEVWVAFLRELRESGYEIWLFFICTENAMLNIARVESRVQLGGHDVPPTKVVSRFQKSIRTAVQAKEFVDRLWLFDNTEANRSHRLVGRFVGGQPDFLAENLPHWMEPFLQS